MNIYKRNSPPNPQEMITKETAHFLKLKEKETTRMRLKAVDAMILLQQRQGVPVAKEIEENPLPGISSQYTDDGKLKFTRGESKKVQRLRVRKHERIESHLMIQNGNEKLTSRLNERFPFILKSELDKQRMMSNRPLNPEVPPFSPM